MLTTEQRIPGLGNGVLQDILFNAGIRPKRELSTFGDLEKDDLFHNLKTTLAEMTVGGGRDTEKDLFGNPGGYRTILSRNTRKESLPELRERNRKRGLPPRRGLLLPPRLKRSEETWMAWSFMPHCTATTATAA